MTAFDPAQEFPPATKADWLEKARASLRGRPPESLVRETDDGIPIQPVHSSAEPCPMPARPAPLARGRGWAVMQRLELPGAAAANAQAREDLNGGADGLALVLRDSAISGGFGLARADMLEALEGLDAELFPLRLDAGAGWSDAAHDLLTLYAARRYDLSIAPLLLNADPFAGEPPTKDAGALARDMAELFAAGPSRIVFSADTRLWHAKGASEAQELAIAAAAMAQMLRLLEDEGIAPDAAAPRISWLLTADADQFLTIAKLRAARLVHARILSAAGLAATPLLLQAESAWRMLTRHDVHVNMLRATSAVFAAGVGGADAITALPFTAALGLPDGFSRRMARNAQIIALEEAGLDKVSDPAAGSAFVEYLTAQLARKAWEIFRRIEAAGGLLMALGGGMIEEMAAEKRQSRARAIARRERPITGVSEFPDLNETPPEVLAPAPRRGLPPRLAEPFEALRGAAEDYRERHGHPPRVFLARAGGAAASPRAVWTAALLAAGGIEAVEGGVEDFSASGCEAAVLCAPDGFCEEHGEEALAALRAAGAAPVWIAGKDTGLDADERLFAGMDALAFLGRAQEALGVGR